MKKTSAEKTIIEYFRSHHKEMAECYIDSEIKDAIGAISNEKLWANGYEATRREDNREPNPHLENIASLCNYLDILNELKNGEIRLEDLTPGDSDRCGGLLYTFFDNGISLINTQLGYLDDHAKELSAEEKELMESELTAILKYLGFIRNQF